ncbi:Lsr2 family protein [Streptomyces sp. NPDC056672]|uniref:histone-like nucleoid-structuring protein Lsr2 n=1 Tax=Streptomyces sp. NPDC056672 TaxID=3345906 RepID=UPI0036923953
MAQRIQVLLTDDLDGGDADQTVTFSLDRKTYEIDLSNTNAGNLRTSLQPFIAAGRRVPAMPELHRQGGQLPVLAQHPFSKAQGGRRYRRLVREWARENRIEVGERGRIPREIYVRYERAHGAGRSRS